MVMSRFGVGGVLRTPPTPNLGATPEIPKEPHKFSSRHHLRML